MATFKQAVMAIVSPLAAQVRVLNTFRVPRRGIIAFNGTVDEIPAAWALCDGANGTPDLRNRFIVCAGGTYSVGDTGGTNSVTLSVNQMPQHSHSLPIAAPFGGASAAPYESTATTSTDNVLLRTGNAGGSEGHENRPPYYALAYIMKL